MERYYPEILRRYLGEERNGGPTNHDETTKSIAGVCGASQSSGSAASGPEPLTREERSRYGEKVKPVEEAAIRGFAADKNWFVGEEDFLSEYESRFIGSGAEQKVYLSEGGKHVLKVNAGRFHTTWLDYNLSKHYRNESYYKFFISVARWKSRIRKEKDLNNSIRH